MLVVLMQAVIRGETRLERSAGLFFHPVDKGGGAQSAVLSRWNDETKRRFRPFLRRVADCVHCEATDGCRANNAPPPGSPRPSKR